jgi:hypothetical protein
MLTDDVSDSKNLLSHSGKNDENEIVSIEKKLEQLSKDGEIILAKINKSCVKMQKTKEKLNW